jgi:cobalamin biosynthesis protein CbiG
MPFSLLTFPAQKSSQGKAGWYGYSVLSTRTHVIDGRVKNMKEVQAVVHLVRALQKSGKSFRIITPYDAQRGRIEDALKQAALHWEDKVFNVDSFQV